MSTMRKIKTKMVKDITANPNRRRFLVKHSRIESDIDPKRQARKWVASKFSRKLVKIKWKKRFEMIGNIVKISKLASGKK